jgi:hypothetical protein
MNIDNILLSKEYNRIVNISLYDLKKNITFFSFSLKRESIYIYLLEGKKGDKYLSSHDKYNVQIETDRQIEQLIVNAVD